MASPCSIRPTVKTPEASRPSICGGVALYPVAINSLSYFRVSFLPFLRSSTTTERREGRISTARVSTRADIPRSFCRRSGEK